MPQSRPLLLGLLLGGGGIAALATLFVQGPGVIIADQARQIEHEIAQRHQVEQERDALRTTAAEVADLRAEVMDLRGVAGRLSLAAARGLRMDALAEAWDYARDGIVLSDSRDGGHWLWCNRAFADALGYTREEVIALGWRNIMHPDDQQRAQSVEGSQWGSRVEGDVFRYRKSARSGGGWVQLRWFCAVYDQRGGTLCVVWVELVN